MIRVLIVDDSAFMRKAIEIILQKDSDIQVVGQAGDGLEALELIDKLSPDVVTMDVEMPRMDGITAVRAIMARSPKPVLMISSVTTQSAEVTLRALEAGAMDFISKPASRVSLDIVNLEQEIRDKVKAVSRRRPPMLRKLSPSASYKPLATSPAGGRVSTAPTAHAPASNGNFGLSVRPSSVVRTPGTTPSSVVVKPAGRVLRDIVSIGVSDRKSTRLNSSH